MPPMEPEKDEEIEVTDDMIVEETDLNDKRALNAGDLADVNEFHSKSELTRKLREGVEKAKKGREDLADTADDALDEVMAMHEEDVVREMEDKELAKMEKKEQEDWKRREEEAAELLRKDEEKAARDASREAFAKQMRDDAIKASDEADELRMKIRQEGEWQSREREAAQLLGEEGMAEVDADIKQAEAEREAARTMAEHPEDKERLNAAIENRGKMTSKLPEGDDRELRAELNVQLEEAEMFEDEWKEARSRLEALKVDVDKPRGLFGKLGLGVKKLFNAEVRTAHNDYKSKLKAWENAKDRIEELKILIGVDESEGGAKMRHKPKSGGSGRSPSGSASIRGENLK